MGASAKCQEGEITVAETVKPEVRYFEAKDALYLFHHDIKEAI